MEIVEAQLDERALTRLSAEAVALLCARDFDTLTQRFPYALAYARKPAAAVAMDLAKCFAAAPSVEAALVPENAHYKVGYFGPNEITLHALIECRFNSPSGHTLLVEMIVTGKEHMALALEDISVFTDDAAVQLCVQADCRGRASIIPTAADRQRLNTALAAMTRRIAILILLWLLPVQPIFACVCAAPDEPLEGYVAPLFEQSTIVGVFEVEGFHFERGRWAILRQRHTFKGNASELRARAPLLLQTNCSVRFRKGELYLVYASSSEALHFSMCSHSGHLMSRFAQIPILFALSK